MNLTLSDIYGEGKNLFPKYPEPGKDFSHGDQFDFYAGEYGPSVIHTEEARFLPIIGDKINVLVGKGALEKSMIDYYNFTYPETFSDKNITTYEEKEYYDLIKEIKKKNLITLHPYSKIGEEKYYIDPNIIFFLNNKKNISKLTKYTPKKDILKLEDIKEINNFPFVLKSFTGASGDGVRIINNNKDLSNALNYFKSEKELIIEEYIDDIDNIGVQLFISKNGEVRIGGISRQIVSKAGEYEGSIFNRQEKIDQRLEKIALEVGQKAFEYGFYGVCGLDFLKDKNGKYFLIDPNFRLTGATPGIFLKNRIFEEKDDNIIQSQQFKSNSSDLKEMFDQNMKLGKNSLYFLSTYQDKINKIISGFSIITGETPEEITYKKKILAKKGFKL